MAGKTDYSWQDKMSAAIAWVMTGSSLKASKLCGVPDKTIRNWTDQDWWPDLIHQAMDMKNTELDALQTTLIHKSLEQVQERVEKGDPVKSKDGGIMYKPVSARDLAWIAAVMIDKRAAVRGIASKITKNVTVTEHLHTLQKGLEDGVKSSEDDVILSAEKVH